MNSRVSQNAHPLQPLFDAMNAAETAMQEYQCEGGHEDWEDCPLCQHTIDAYREAQKTFAKALIAYQGGVN